jgi:predicted TIM-barrel fold metal-dependent hydrolase
VIIDCHNHPDWHGHDLTKFLANMDRHGIAVTWLLSWECPEDEYDTSYNHVIPGGPGGPIPFSRVLSYVERAPTRFVPGYCPDPRRPDAIDRLKAAVAIYGVRLCGELKLRMCYDNPDALRLYRYCGEAGLPVTVHIDYEFDTGRTYPRPNWWYGGGIDAFARALRACPGTTFLGHAPGFWAHISGDDKATKAAYPDGEVAPGGKLVDLLRTCPNLCCDISAGSGCRALSRDKKHARQFLLEFQDRVLYGRDWFDNAHQELLAELDLPPAVLDKIYRGNASRLVPPATT